MLREKVKKMCIRDRLIPFEVQFSFFYAKTMLYLYIMKNVYLIGLMGSGKTTLGRILAQRVHRKHVDTDDLIETYFSMAIPQVFAEKGEEMCIRDRFYLE